MPFTIEGKWIPSKATSKTSLKPVKVRLLKRGNSVVTVVLNLNMSDKEKKELASTLKRKMGTGGAVKEGNVEIQGDKVEEIIKCLAAIDIKAS